jgi:PAS domain-containing protein
MWLPRILKDKKELCHKLREREKELACLYSFAEIVETEGMTKEEIMKRLAIVLPKSWQYPDLARARIRLDDEKYLSEDFRETDWEQSADIIVSGIKRGGIDVFYIKERPVEREGPFLKEERELLEAVAERLGRVIERLETKRELKKNLLFFRCLVEKNAEAIIIFDNSKKVEYANDAAKLLFNEDYSPLREHLSSIRENGPKISEIQMKRSNGEKLVAEMFANSASLAGRKIYIMSLRDITRRKDLREELEKKLNELEIFYEASLGREMRIIELKEQIDELMSRINELED